MSGSLFFNFDIYGSTAPRTDRHRLAGTITVDGQPAGRVVVVFNRLTLNMVAVTVSNNITGTWEIKGIAEQPEKQLLIFSLDNTGAYNAEIADYVSQVATV